VCIYIFSVGAFIYTHRLTYTKCYVKLVYIVRYKCDIPMLKFDSFDRSAFLYKVTQSKISPETKLHQSKLSYV